MCTSGIAGAIWYFGPPVPECVLTTTSSSSHAAHSGSYDGSYIGLSQSAVTGGLPTSTPPRRPFSLHHCTSAMASSTSFRKIWPMPARASGFCEQ